MNDSLRLEDSPIQVWYADDGAAGGTLSQLQVWWNHLCKEGPLFGYYPKPSKSVLVVKEGMEELAKQMFPGLKVTSGGYRYLGSFIGLESGKDDFMRDRMEEWENDVKELSTIAATDPQAAYAAFIYGTSKRWMFVARTTPNCAKSIKHLDWL